jgi:hypothetical protein
VSNILLFDLTNDPTKETASITATLIIIFFIIYPKIIVEEGAGAAFLS